MPLLEATKQVREKNELKKLNLYCESKIETLVLPVGSHRKSNWKI